MRNIYFFSGLGADKRVFQSLQFRNFQPMHIEWVTPLPNETIASYAWRLTEQIHEDRPILAGLSFGGMMAIEVAKLIDTEKVILLASAKTKNEIPPYYRWAGIMGMHKLLPDFIIRRPGAFANWFFGTENELDRKELAAILTESDPVFVRWAIDQLVKWQNHIVHPNFIHIHGTSDKALPRYFTKNTVSIPGAGHFMTLNRSSELATLIESFAERQPDSPV